MAAQQGGGFKYWLGGLPEPGLGPTAKGGTFKYWKDGLPYAVVWPTAAPPEPGPVLLPPGGRLLCGVGL